MKEINSEEYLPDWAIIEDYFKREERCVLFVTLYVISYLLQINYNTEMSLGRLYKTQY